MILIFEKQESRQQAEAATAAAIAATTAAAAAAVASTASGAPKIVKTTTKQTMVQSADGFRHNNEQKVEDLTPGGSGAVTVTSSTNKVKQNLNVFRSRDFSQK